MRVYGRQVINGVKKWVLVETDPVTGSNDAVNCVWLAQTLKTEQGECPRDPSWGVPSIRAIQEAKLPTTAVRTVQENFLPYFAYLRIAPAVFNGPYNASYISYNVSLITLSLTSYAYVVNGALPQ